MIMRLAAVFLCFGLLATAAAAADASPSATTTAPSVSNTNIETLFQRFGLFGAWAADCNEPASPSNPHVSVTTPSQGLVLEDDDLGPGYAVNRYSITTAEPIAANRLAMTVIFRPGSELEERQKLILKVRDNTRRTLFNQPEGGAVRVKDGIVLGRGNKTPLLKKCDQGDGG